MTEDREQRTEDREQRTEDRGQRILKLEVGMRNSERRTDDKERVNHG